MQSDDMQMPGYSYNDLKVLAGDLSARLSGSDVDGLAGGPGWLRLSFPATDRHDLLHLHMIARPGAILIWDSPGVLPKIFDSAMNRVKQRDLSVTPHLRGARLAEIHVPKDERILRLVFHPPPGRTATMLAMQCFGSCGNLALVDHHGRRLWSAHGSPHPLLLESINPSDRVQAQFNTRSAANARENAERLLGDALGRDLAGRLDVLLKRALKSTERLVVNLRRDLENARQGDLYRHQGETLAIHLHSLKRGLEKIELADAGGQRVTIRLDPSRSPSENMAAYFKKARKADRGQQRISDRLTATEAQLRTLKQRAAELAELPRQGEEALERLQDWRHSQGVHLQRFEKQVIVGHRRTQETSLRFRRYLIDDKWAVWIGRDNRENDELTHRAAAPTDLWFHAQGVSGSHVILRTAGKPENVPGSVIEKAASLAALYSKARNSDLVPVIHTLKKYVRKPRKSPPGLATCEREKSLMVPPEVAGGVRESRA